MRKQLREGPQGAVGSVHPSKGEVGKKATGNETLPADQGSGEACRLSWDFILTTGP